MIALYISDTQISFAHYSRVHGSPLLTNITAIDLPGSLVKDLNREEVAVNHLIHAIHEANDKIFFAGNEILISLSDSLVFHEAFQTEQDLPDADIITLMEWKKDKRWGSTAEKFQAFIELYNDRCQGHIIYVHDFLIKAIKKILRTFSGSPVWLGTKSTVLSALGTLPIMTIKLTDSHYDVFHMDRDNFSGGTVIYGKSGLKCINSFGNISALQQLLNTKFTMRNKPPYTICLDDLSTQRIKHWDRFKPQQPKLFTGLLMDDTKIDPDLILDHKIVLSTMVAHRNINLGLNMFDPLEVLDHLYHGHESIALPIEYEPADRSSPKPTILDTIASSEDVVEPKPDKHVRKKRIWFRLQEFQITPFLRKQKFVLNNKVSFNWSSEEIISFFSTLLLLGSFGGTVYYKEAIVRKAPGLEYEYINAVNKQSEKRLVSKRLFPRITSRIPIGELTTKEEKISLQSAAIEQGLTKVFMTLEPGQLTYLSSSETILSVEFVDGKIPSWQPENIGLIISTSHDEINCCGGYKYYADLELTYTDLIAESEGVELSVDAIMSILKADYSTLRIIEQSHRKLGNRLQTSLVLQVESEIQVRNMLSKVSGIAINILIRKLIYKADPEKLQATGTFYLSIIHPKIQPQQYDSLTILTAP